MSAARVGLMPWRRERPGVPARVWAMALIAAVVVLVQVVVMPNIRLIEGVPDVIAPAVVGIALMRGGLAAGVAGAAMGLLAELVAPVGMVGGLALIYLGAGAFAGRYFGRREVQGPLGSLVLSVIVAGMVQLAYLGLHMLVGAPVEFGDFVGRVLLPTMLLTALLSAPVLLVIRRSLSRPRDLLGPEVSS